MRPNNTDKLKASIKGTWAHLSGSASGLPPCHATLMTLCMYSKRGKIEVLSEYTVHEHIFHRANMSGLKIHFCFGFYSSILIKINTKMARNISLNLE